MHRWTTTRPRRGHQRLDQLPLRVGQVGRIALVLGHKLSLATSATSVTQARRVTFPTRSKAVRRRHSGDPIQVPDGHRDRALSRQGHNHVVRNVRLRRRIGAEEGEREVDRLDERGAARERIRDQFPDLLGQASFCGEPGEDVGDQLVSMPSWTAAL
jgi:hypothetical protein